MKHITLTILFTILISMVSDYAWADASGDCGTTGHESDVTWSFVSSTGVLTISGTGDMADYTDSWYTPWASQLNNITSVVIGDGVTRIGNYVLMFCSNLASVTIHNSVTSIGKNAFQGCTSLTSIVIPNSVTSIEESAFQGCTSLASIDIPNSVTSIGRQAFGACSSLTSVVIPNSVTNIGNQAFSNCENLTSVSIPSSVTNMGPGAFMYCTSLTSVVIPNSVTSIGYQAFKSCSSLASVTIYAPSLITYGAYAFDGNASGRKIYVFSDCVSTYQTEWSTYSSAIKPITVAAHEGATGEFWSTYYNSMANALVPSGTQVFKAILDESKLTLIKIGDDIIKAGEAVILKSDVSSIPLASSAASASDYSDNSLHGFDMSTTISGSVYDDVNTTLYTLAKGTKGVGFYKYTGTTLGAHKAFLAITNPSPANEYLFSFDEGTTSMKDVSSNMDAARDSAVYDLQGRKVQQPVRGIYVKNGRKFIIK